MNGKSKSSDILIGALIAGTLSAAAILLLTPKSGSKLRESIRDKINGKKRVVNRKVVNKAKTLTRKVVKKATHAAHAAHATATHHKKAKAE